MWGACKCAHVCECMCVCKESELIQQMQAGATNRMRRRRVRGVCERQQRRGLIALHHGLGNSRFAGGGLWVGESVCMCVCPCVCVCIPILVYSPSAVGHMMIKDWPMLNPCSGAMVPAPGCVCVSAAHKQLYSHPIL